MNLHFLGGAMEIGGSAIYIRIGGRGILMDCGIRQSGTKDPIPDFRTIQEQGGLDAILVSHAHMDHIGTLPIISKAYPSARIYMTHMTADLTRVLLYDSLKIMKYREDEIPHYSEPDVLEMLKRVHPVGYQTPFPILDRFTLTFYPAGHIAGAACIYLVSEEGSLFYSGDFSAFSQRTIEGIRIPKLRPDIAILETTYGTRLHANRQVEERRLAELVKECILQKKKILIPAFALGRAQEVLLILRSAIQNQEIPAVPVYVDGMVRDINSMYLRNPTYLKNALGKRILKGNDPFYTKEIQPVAANQDRNALMSGPDPVILLSSSGMLTGGPSAQYAARLAPSENACIIITGYQDEESPGRQLLNVMENPEGASLTINGSSVPVKCRIEQVGLSAHGDRSEIMALLERLSARRVFLVHGNRDTIGELGNELAAEDYRRQIFLPECGQAYEVTLHTRRKQSPFVPAYTMQMGQALTAENERLLWDYWQEHYPGKAFSVSQIAYIWYGKPSQYPQPDPGPEHSGQDLQTILETEHSGQGLQAVPETEHSGQGLQTVPGSEYSGPPHPLPSGPDNLREDAARQADGPRLSPDERILLKMQDFLWNSRCFAPNARRLFLFEPKPPEEMALAYAPKELTQQQLAALAEDVFREYPYRKISYHNDRKEILLQFDYPDSLDTEAFSEKAESFSGKTGWKIRISPSMNHNAAALLLSMLFGGRLVKTSYYPEKKTYAVTLSEAAGNGALAAMLPSDSDGFSLGDPEAAKRFASETGWRLLINRPSQDANDADAAIPGQEEASDFFSPSGNAPAAEQNLAFFCIDQAFDELPHKPDKKSLKQDTLGKYLEISFISPTIGRKYEETLQGLSDQTGWRIRIADRVNQIELFKAAQLLCMKYGITPAKNPSYLPGTRSVQLKVAGSPDPECLQKAAGEFEEATGCSLAFLQ